MLIVWIKTAYMNPRHKTAFIIETKTVYVILVILANNYSSGTHSHCRETDGGRPIACRVRLRSERVPEERYIIIIKLHFRLLLLFHCILCSALL